jgi:hypothetical protein
VFREGTATTTDPDGEAPIALNSCVKYKPDLILCSTHWAGYCPKRAISQALSVFADANVRYSRHPAVVDAISVELGLGISRVPGRVLPEARNAYICALLALKAIPHATSSFQGQAVFRLLRVAAAEIAKHRFIENCYVKCVPTKL